MHFSSNTSIDRGMTTRATTKAPARTKRSKTVRQTRVIKKRPQTAKARTAKPAAAAIDLKGLCSSYGLTRQDITRFTGYSPRAVENWASGSKTSAASTRALRELESILSALAELMETSYVGEWLKTPNQGFHGATPMQVIERGDAGQVWQMITLTGTGEPR